MTYGLIKYDPHATISKDVPGDHRAAFRYAQDAGVVLCSTGHVQWHTIITVLLDASLFAKPVSVCGL